MIVAVGVGSVASGPLGGNRPDSRQVPMYLGARALAVPARPCSHRRAHRVSAVMITVGRYLLGMCSLRCPPYRRRGRVPGPIALGRGQRHPHHRPPARRRARVASSARCSPARPTAGGHTAAPPLTVAALRYLLAIPALHRLRSAATQPVTRDRDPALPAVSPAPPGYREAPGAAAAC